MKLFKRTLAIFVSAVLALGCLAGCHGKDAVVATAAAADGSTISITSGVYLAMLLEADSEARNLVAEQLGDNATSDVDYTKQSVTVGDKSYKFFDYVAMRAKEICRDYITTRYLFLKNGCKLSEDEQSSMSTYIQYQWSYTGGVYLYEPNGVSYSSFENYMKVTSYERSNLFDFYYDNGGEKEPAADVIKDGLEDNYLIVNMIQIATTDDDGKALAEDKLAEIEAKLKGYADRITAGEDFKTVNDEYEAEVKEAEKAEEGESTSSEAASSEAETETESETESDEPKPADELAKLFGSAESSVGSDANAVALFDEFIKLEIGKPTVLKGEDGYYRMVIRKDILADEYYYNSLKNEITRILYADEFEKFIEQEGEKLQIEYNSYELDYLKPKKIDYTEYYTYYTSLMSQSTNG